MRGVTLPSCYTWHLTSTTVSADHGATNEAATIDYYCGDSQGSSRDDSYVNETSSYRKIRPLPEAITTAVTEAADLKTNNDSLVVAMVTCKENIEYVNDLKAVEVTKVFCLIQVFTFNSNRSCVDDAHLRCLRLLRARVILAPHGRQVKASAFLLYSTA